MKSFREFAILLLSSFCCIMVHAQKEYNGVITVRGIVKITGY